MSAALFRMPLAHARLPLMAALAGTMLAAPCLTAQDAPADSRPTVAVMPFNNGAIGKAHVDLDPLSGGIMDLLTTELTRNPGVRVVERGQIEKLIQEQRLDSTGRVDQATAVQVGRLLGVHHMIFGGFVTDPRGDMRLDARAVDVETGQVEYVETVQDKSDNVMGMVSQLAEKMNKGMKLPGMPKRTADAAPTKAPMAVVLLYSRAIQQENSGHPDRALELYRQAADQDFPAARQAVARLQPATSSSGS